MPSPVFAHRESQPSDSQNAAGAESPNRKRRWLGGLTGLFRSDPPAPVTGEAENALLAFPSEATRRATPAPAFTAAPSTPLPVAPPPDAGSPETAPAAALASRKRFALVTAGVVAAVALVVAGALLGGRALSLGSIAREPQTATLTVQTRPAGSEVLIDGQPRGVTPLTLSLVSGAHSLAVRHGADERVVPLTMVAGSDVTQHFEMRPAEQVALFGAVSVATDPPGARVAVDGKPRGVSPVVVTDLTAEAHAITVTNESGSAERTVAVAAGASTSVMFSLVKNPGPVGGWLAISSPFDVEVAENNDIVGSSGTNRIMLAAGRHDLVLANSRIGYRESKRIDVIAGKTTSIRVEPPRVAISVNARPWAEILIDGTSLGQTPISNVLATVGSHELVFKHPQFGERKQTVVVTANGPNRIAADLTR